MISSPKRKRSHATGEAQDRVTLGILGLQHHDSPLTPQGTHQHDEEGSPRAKVAKTLEGLHLDPAPANNRELSASPAPSTHLATITSNRVGNLTEDGYFQDRPALGREDVVSTETIIGLSHTQSELSPLGDNINDEFWSDAEITGHKPTDPDDDGYGLNGLGFQPTTAMAYSRSQRRKQQIADYRYRRNKRRKTPKAGTSETGTFE